MDIHEILGNLESFAGISDSYFFWYYLLYGERSSMLGEIVNQVNEGYGASTTMNRQGYNDRFKSYSKIIHKTSQKHYQDLESDLTFTNIRNPYSGSSENKPQLLSQFFKITANKLKGTISYSLNHYTNSRQIISKYTNDKELYVLAYYYDNSELYYLPIFASNIKAMDGYISTLRIHRSIGITYGYEKFNENLISYFLRSGEGIKFPESVKTKDDTTFDDWIYTYKQLKRRMITTKPKKGKKKQKARSFTEFKINVLPNLIEDDISKKLQSSVKVNKNLFIYMLDNAKSLYSGNIIKLSLLAPSPNNEIGDGTFYEIKEMKTSTTKFVDTSIKELKEEDKNIFKKSKKTINVVGNMITVKNFPPLLFALIGLDISGSPINPSTYFIPLMKVDVFMGKQQQQFQQQQFQQQQRVPEQQQQFQQQQRVPEQQQRVPELKIPIKKFTM